MPEPLVLLPGMNCSPRLWDGVVAEMRAHEPDRPRRQVILAPLDQPSIDGQVDELLDRLPARFTLGGLSLGAIVAMALHRRAPERVAGLFLVATNSREPTGPQQAAWEAQLERLAAGARARDLQEDLLDVLVGEHPAPGLRERTLELADDVGSAVLADQLRLQRTRVDERPALSTVTVPCTIVAAADDLICPVDRHVEIHALVPGSEMVVLPDAPHLVALSDPQRVAAAMAVWLERVSG
jgi:pimeloyl-ACP methyl ester carboxylesterase